MESQRMRGNGRDPCQLLLCGRKVLTFYVPHSSSLNKIKQIHDGFEGVVNFVRDGSRYLSCSRESLQFPG